MAVDAYPLQWPAGWPRTAAAERKRAQFRRTETKKKYADSESYYRTNVQLSIAGATARVLTELGRLGADERSVVVSSNLELRRDGLPRSGQRAPDDPGIAVYWTDPDTKRAQCMAIDLYDTAAGNLAAVAATIEAMRAIERHGGATILNRAFAGFTALPSATTTALSTQAAAEVLARRSGNASASHAILKDIGMAREAYRRAAAKTHPDVGGNAEDFKVVQEAKRVLETHFGGSL